MTARVMVVVADGVLNGTSGDRQDRWWIVPIHQRSRIHLAPPTPKDATFLDPAARPLTTLVIPVRCISQDTALYSASPEYPCPAVNPARTQARAAVRTAPACSSSR